ncbi:MAG: YceI family protein [Candidatus Cyclobacteriaceae bacterium M2_1C_046]
MKKLHILTVIFLFIIGVVSAQEYTLDRSSELSISGTSSLHDWTMTAEKVQGSGEFVVDGKRITDIKNLEIIVDAESLKSGKGGMDKNAYKALNTDKYRQITFTLIECQSVRTTDNINNIKAKGKLTISGVTREVTMNTDCQVLNGRIECSGSFPLNMTDFNIEPPTAMFGTITTGEKITVNYRAVFKK